MAETGFKHIAVTAAEEDDFVIRAGVPEQPATVPEPEPEDLENQLLRKRTRITRRRSRISTRRKCPSRRKSSSLQPLSALSVRLSIILRFCANILRVFSPLRDVRSLREERKR